MKRLFMVILLLLISACAQSGDGFVQDPVVDPQPDPIITTPIDSRFVGKVAANQGGTAKELAIELEYREKLGGKLIGYGQVRNKLEKDPVKALEVDFYQQGQRNNADVSLDLRISDQSCVNIKIKGKLNLAGDIAVPRTSQSLCGAVNMTIEAFTLKREGATAWSFWPDLEAYFAKK
jgi:hypothetical protein